MLGRITALVRNKLGKITDAQIRELCLSFDAEEITGVDRAFRPVAQLPPEKPYHRTYGYAE